MEQKGKTAAEICIQMQKDLNEVRKQKVKAEEKAKRELEAANTAIMESKQTEAELRAVILCLVTRYCPDGTAIISKKNFDRLTEKVKSGESDFAVGQNWGGDYLISKSVDAMHRLDRELDAIAGG